MNICILSRLKKKIAAMNEQNKVNLNLQCSLGDFIESHLFKAIALLRYLFFLLLKVTSSLPKSFYRKTVTEEMCKI